MKVHVEKAVGPMFGYYHKPGNSTVLGAVEMDLEEAEDLGYSPCGSCFASSSENGGKDDA